ncbi:MAG TPA: HAD family hydrolase [Longimicrobium sp.]|nr:HAD family hydrolase [Longimicrobium sp.]
MARPHPPHPRPYAPHFRTASVTQPSAAPGLRPAVFLDRDGTIIHDREYLADPAGVELLPGAAEAIARLNRAGFFVVLVTNQSGIGRGYFTEDDYQAVHRRLIDLLEVQGARLDADYHCPLAPDDPDPERMRKPGAGMFLLAAREHRLDLSRSWLIGDRLRDVSAAAEFGARAMLVRSAQTESPAPEGVRVASSLLDAVRWFLDSAEPTSPPSTLR